MPRFSAAYCDAISASAFCTVARGMSSKTAASRAIETGSPAAKSRLARIDFNRSSSTHPPSCRGAALEKNRAEAHFLKRANVAPAYQLEQRHERRDYERSIVRVLEQRDELDSAGAFERAQDSRDTFRDRDVAQRDFARGLVGDALEHGTNCLDQIENRNGVLLGVRVFGCGLAGRSENVASQQCTLGELFSCLAIALIFEQALDQVALELLGLLGVRELRMRQHRERLDQEQRRRHHQVLARDVEVQLIEQFEPRQVLLGDNAGGDFVRVELGALEQMQEQVERALVNREPEANAGISRELGRRVAFVFVAHSCTIQIIALYA